MTGKKVGGGQLEGISLGVTGFYDRLGEQRSGVSVAWGEETPPEPSARVPASGAEKPPSGAAGLGPRRPVRKGIPESVAERRGEAEAWKLVGSGRMKCRPAAGVSTERTEAVGKAGCGRRGRPDGSQRGEQSLSRKHAARRACAGARAAS